jgi:hypothetical protein
MPAFALVALGAAVLVGTIAAARRTRRQPDRIVSATDPWAPLGMDGPDDRPSMRLWPVAAVLTGLIMIAGGLVVSQARQASAPSSSPFLIEVGSPSPAPESPEPEETPQESISPSPSASPPPSASPRRTASPAPRPSSTPSPTKRPPTPEPTPTPPPKPGPFLGASTSCFRDNGGTHASISYSANARSGTTLQSLTLSLDGPAVQRPSVRGRTSFSSSYSADVDEGRHTFTVGATGSDEGRSTQSYQACL